MIQLPKDIYFKVVSNKGVHELELVQSDVIVHNLQTLSLTSTYDVDPVNTIKISGDFPEYAGPYEVIPSAKSDITLNTKDKVCVDNVIVNKITKFETANPGGGYTLYIAEME